MCLWTQTCSRNGHLDVLAITGRTHVHTHSRNQLTHTHCCTVSLGVKILPFKRQLGSPETLEDVSLLIRKASLLLVVTRGRVCLWRERDLGAVICLLRPDALFYYSLNDVVSSEIVHSISCWRSSLHTLSFLQITSELHMQLQTEPTHTGGKCV